MEIIKNASGYAPLQLNLAGYWDKGLADLPSELQDIVTHKFSIFRLHPWDSLTVENRQRIAAQRDYQHDPNHEPSTYFTLCCFKDDLDGWIEKARKEYRDSVVVALRDVADRIEKILDDDRERVGAEIQELRAIKEKSAPTNHEKELSTNERNTMLRVIAALAVSGYKYPGHGKKAEMLADFDRNGMAVDEKTLTKYLKQAEQYIPSKLGQS